MRKLREFLGRPELLVVLFCVFGIAFCWPLFTFKEPERVFGFLFVAWVVSIVLLFAASQFGIETQDEEDNAAEGGAEHV